MNQHRCRGPSRICVRETARRNPLGPEPLSARVLRQVPSRATRRMRKVTSSNSSWGSAKSSWLIAEFIVEQRFELSSLVRIKSSRSPVDPDPYRGLLQVVSGLHGPSAAPVSGVAGCGAQGLRLTKSARPPGDPLGRFDGRRAPRRSVRSTPALLLRAKQLVDDEAHVGDRDRHEHGGASDRLHRSVSLPCGSVWMTICCAFTSTSQYSGTLAVA